ncbi:MAG: hypothetical protein Fues2KO_49970 [Fuerstiella sp.]
MRILLVTSLFLLQAVCVQADEDPKKKAILDPSQAGDDFQLQGEYAGTIGDDAVKIGIQVIAMGDGNFRSVGYLGGLPGDGWDGSEETRIPGTGKMEGDILVLKSDNPEHEGRAEIKDGSLKLIAPNGNQVADLPKVNRRSPTIGAKPPEGAVVLFDGSDAKMWTPDGKLSEDNLLIQGVTSKQKFGSYKLHMEFLLSYMPQARGQARSNSGFYNQGRYEVQILDSFGLEGKNNECGGIYEISDPKVNMCFPPLSWQTYDVEFHAAKFDDQGQKTANAWVTVKHNGVVVQDKTELPRTTRAAPVKEGPEPGPIYFQDHSNPVRFRNIWVLPIDD